MDFEIKSLVITFMISIVCGFIIIPILKQMKVGQTERAEGPASHLKKNGTPTMGGVIIIVASIISTIFTYCILKIRGEPEQFLKVFPLLLMALGFATIGFIDDFKKVVLKNTEGLKPSRKMLGLLVISILYVLYLVYGVKIGTSTYIPILKKEIVMPLYAYIPFLILVSLGTTNAVNLTDGIDGLAASICVIIITALTVIGMNFNIFEISAFGSIVIGATLGFLMFNIHPAKVFMGDTGSLMLGGVISGLALYLKMPMLLLVIAIIPVIETLSVIMQVVYFKKTGKRIFKMTPIHHHFELSGWKENKVVIIFSLITLIACFVGIKII